jgi:8-oxo-dGTP pyrophosphatase MutT (NUDIX family)
MPATRFYYRDPSAPKPTMQTLGVSALIEQDGKLLLERRRDTGQWGLIGGRVELDESLEQALLKEVREETGLTVTGYGFFGTFSDPSRIGVYSHGPVIRFVVLAYTVEVESFEPLQCSDESLELGIFSRAELADLDIVPTGRDIVEAYLSGRTFVLD